MGCRVHSKIGLKPLLKGAISPDPSLYFFPRMFSIMLSQGSWAIYKVKGVSVARAGLPYPFLPCWNPKEGYSLARFSVPQRMLSPRKQPGLDHFKDPRPPAPRQHSRSAETSKALCNQARSLLRDYFVELREIAFKKRLCLNGNSWDFIFFLPRAEFSAPTS